MLKTESRKALRIKAEQSAQKILVKLPKKLANCSREEIKKMLFELRVHQIELEMQNDELSQAQTELEAAQTLYFDLFNQAPVGYCILSKDGLIMEANLAANTMLGVTHDELVKQPINRFIYKEDQDASYLYSKKIFETGTPQICELRMVKKDGAIIWVRLEATIAQDKGIAPICRIMLSDITSKKQSDEELLKSQKIEALGLLVGGIAHDFNNILMVIMGNVSFAKMYFSPTNEAYKHLTIAETSCLNAKELTQQFLTFAKGGAPVKSQFSMANLVKASCRLTLSGTQSTCEYTIPDDLWNVDGDNAQIGQVMSNVLINADQSMQTGGLIRVNCENVAIREEDELPVQNGNYIKVSVKDQGNGIPEKYLNKIFDPYFTTKESNRGLGLAAVYSIMKKHGGHIAVESAADLGTTITLLFPASSSPVTTPMVDEPKIIPGNGKILVMDDNEVLLQVVKGMLDTLGYEVACAKDGVEAIAKYTEAQQTANPFDAVIMDLTVPGGMGGKEAMQNLLAIDPQARVIVSSGYFHDPIMADYRDYGFKGVIAKPYSLGTLSELMQKVLHNHEQPCCARSKDQEYKKCTRIEAN